MNHKASPDAGIGRRDFLIVSAATLGAAATMSAATGPLSVLKTSNPFLSVGFAEAAGGNAASAGRLRADFAGAGARVTVHGLWRGAGRRDATTVDVSAFYQADGASVPFLAWSGSPASTSPSVRFTVPVDESGSVALGVEQRRTAGRRPLGRLGRLLKVDTRVDELPRQEKLAEEKSLCRLGTGATDDLKLRRGTYFVALLREGDAEPRWSAITAGAIDSADGVVLRRGEAPVDFDYMVISVDAA